METRTVLLIVSGGIAAYRSLELIRLLRKAGFRVLCVLTEGGQKFVTPLSVSALSEEPVFCDLWAPESPTSMDHIALARTADVIVVAPASAGMIGKMAAGLADDLAGTLLLAARAPVLIAPAMNPAMWSHPAVQDNLRTLRQRGVECIGPVTGETLCGDHGTGRMAEPEHIAARIGTFFAPRAPLPLSGKRALVTSGPTWEPIDPVRFLANRSSGRQGHAIAAALAQAGATVQLITGPVCLPDPPQCTVLHVETAQEMREAVRKSLPADIAVCAAAVCDWRPESYAGHKQKKDPAHPEWQVTLTQNPDILAEIATLPADSGLRPRLVIGFAAETENLMENARAKRISKGCDWIVANAVGTENPVFGADHNRVHLITATETLHWPENTAPPLTKEAIASKLAAHIASTMGQG